MNQCDPRHAGIVRLSRISFRAKGRNHQPMWKDMGAVLAGLLVAGACLLAVAPAASAHAEKPRSAATFRDSVGVVTHSVYYDTAYGNWPRVVAKLDELGVRHLRDGLSGNPAPAWRDWNERYFRAIDLAAAHGMRFDFIVGKPGNPAGTLDQLLSVAGGRLRHATEALEEPNEVDHFNGGTRGWAWLRATAASSTARSSATRRCASCR